MGFGQASGGAHVGRTYNSDQPSVGQPSNNLFDSRYRHRVFRVIDEAASGSRGCHRLDRDEAGARSGVARVNVLSEDRDGDFRGDAGEVGDGRCDRRRDTQLPTE